MELPVNRFKHLLAAGTPQLGFWCMLSAPSVTEILARSGIDWVLIDTEHAPNELPDIYHHLRAVQGSAASALVRPAWNDMVVMKRLLDAGVQSFIIPYVQSADEAAAAVAATRYPPAGIRGVAATSRAAGYGAVSGYLTKAADEIAVVVQIESATGVDNLEAILAVDGIDGVFVGPSDLAASYGHLGDPDADEVQAVIGDIIARTRAANGRAGILARSSDDAKRCLSMGYHFVSIASDLTFVTAGAAARLAELRG
ncbi:MAG: HpcH/HpaI aldolase/citrate lyase family protein [Pseudomonadota bacterium]